MFKKTPHAPHNHGASGALKSAAEIAQERRAAAPEVTSPPETPTAAEIEALRAEAAKSRENWDHFLRAQADLENFRKRAAREKQEILKTASEKLLLELLPPLDHFEMGLQSVPQTETPNPLREGMEMVLSQFRQFLKIQGVSEIEAFGKPFDPAVHEAVAHQESDEPEGQVINQLRKGYRLHHKLLRPATVIVAKPRPSDGNATPSSEDEPPANGTTNVTAGI